MPRAYEFGTLIPNHTPIKRYIQWTLARYFLSSVEFFQQSNQLSRCETLLRIWDVFLLEGEKVLFRVAIALLLQQQDILLRQSDTLAFWKSMKIAVSLVYDYEELLSIAFNGFKMVKRKELKSRREAKMRELEKRHQLSCALDELKAKGQVNNISGRDAPQSPRTFFASALDESSPCFIMSCAENDSYVLKLGNTDEDVYYAIEGRFDAPITCASWIKDSHILLGSAKGYLYAYDIGPKQKTWELKMSGGITAITIDRQRGGTKHAFVGTANGILSLIVDLTGETAPRDLYSQTLGFIAVSFISIIDTQLWCACGCVLEVFDVTTFDHIRKITVSENPLDSICCLAPCSNGVWISLVGKTSLKLLSTSTFEPTCYCDISRYLPSRGSNALLESENPDRVTAVLANDSYLFIGTGSGIVCIYKTLKWKNSTLPHVKKLQTSTRHSINISEYKTSPKILSRSLHRLTSKEEGDSDIDEVPCNAAPEIGSPRSGSQDAINFSSCTDTTVEDEKPTLLKGAVPRMRGPLVNSLNLLFNIKSQITESPIRAFLQVTNKQGNCIVSISQRSNEDDAVLKWVQKNKGGCPWTNEPMFELCLKDSTPILPGYLKSATLRKIPSVDSTFHLQ
ncbi:TBC1 domain family member 2A [Echinococcus granulosus]|nr:TBC1 domain family member 2A [Echinococcus granulosus]